MKNISVLSFIALILICAGIQTGKAQSTLQFCIYDVDGGSGDTACSAFSNDACIDGADYGDVSEKFSDPFTLPCVNTVDSIQFDLYYFDCDSFDVVTFSFYLNGSLIGTYQDLSGGCSCTPLFYPLSLTFTGALIDSAFNPSGQNVISVQHDGLNMAVAGYSATIFYPGLSADVGVIAIPSPVSACGLTTTENVTITVQNFGTASQNQIDVAYSVNGGPAVTGKITPPLASGNSTSYTFSTTADLSLPGTYSFKAWTFLSGEMCTGNDTLSGYIVINGAPPVVYPYIENFESQANCSQNCGIACNLTGTFQNVTTDGTDWAVDAGGTPTNNTGPSVDHTLGTAAGKYIYVEASGACNPSITAVMESGCFDISSMTNPLLGFWYHMAGAAMGRLNTEIYSAGSWIPVDSIIGTQQLSETDPWLEKNIDLSPFSGIIKVRFTGITGTGTQSDMAIDDIKIYEILADDIGVLSVNSPQSGCLSANESITLTVVNNGLNTAVNIPLYYSIDSGAVVSDTISAMMNPGDTIQFTFSSTADFSLPGNYSVSVWVSMTGDGNPSNDSIGGYTVQSLTPYSTYPYLEDFETQTLCAENCGTPCTITGNFFNASSDNTDWTVDEGGTPTFNTGPTVDHTLGSATGNYLYIEASNPCFPNQTALLQSSCFDLSSLTMPVLSFWYHMAGAGMGKLYTEVFSGGVWNRVDSLVGPQQTAETDPWLKRNIYLSAFTGTVQIRFAGVTGTASSSDMAIDDLEISDAPSDDAAVLAIVSPATDCQLTSAEQVTVQVFNAGSSVQSSIPVSYSINGGPAVNDTLITALSPGDTAAFTFAVTADLSAPGTYSINAWSSLGSDNDNSNDSVIGYLVQNLNVVSSFPFLEDFESQATCATTCMTACTITGNFTNAASDNTDWTVNEGNTPSTTTGPTVDHTTSLAAGNYIYLEATTPCFPNITAVLESGCFDIGSLSSPSLSFWYHMAGAAMGKLYTDVYSGSAWYRIDSLVGAQQAAEADPWLKRSLSLSSFTGIIRIRFTGVTANDYSSDMAIDDIEIFDGPSVDIAMVSMDAPVSGCALGSSENITVTIQNLSATAQTNITVSYTVNGGSPVNEIITDTIQAGGTLQYTFSAAADLSAYTTYQLNAWVSLGADSNNTNDSITGYSVSNNPVCCIPTYGSACTSDDYIDGVDFAGIYNSGTGCNNNPDNYIYDSTSIANVSTGNAYSITITPSALWDQGIGVWIDFNQNGLFSDSGEFVFSSPPSMTPVSGNITIPITALPGNTIMRIRCVYNYEPVSTDDCNNQQFGETEDYPVAISAPFTDVSVNSFLSPVTGCGLSANEMVEIVVENTGSTPVTGIVISWTVNGGPAVTETITDTIPPLSIYSYIFTAAADLSATGTYSFAAWISAPGDTIFSNDTIMGYIISNVSGITVDLGSDTAICGTYVLEAGNPGASFLWSTGETTQQITVSSSGSYWVEVNAAGCPPAYDTVIIVISAPVIVNLGPDTAACTDTIMLDAGNPGATYFWSTGATTKTMYVTISGTYWVDVTGAGGCKVRDSINISIAPPPLVDLGIDAAYCASHVLDAGNPGASYTWSTGATSQTVTVTSSGVYSVTVTSGPGCSATDNIVLVIYPGPMVDLGIDTSLCSAGSITLDAGGGTNLTYQWSTGASTQTITVTNSGIYSVVVTNTTSGCTDSDTIIIVISPNLPTASFTYSDSGLTVTFANNSANSISWWWTFGDVTGTSDLQNPVYTYSSPGTYVVTLTATNACGTNVFSDTITVDIIGIYDPEFNVKFSVIPNPADDEFTIAYSGSSRLVSVAIACMDGKEIKKIKTGDSFRMQQHFDATKLPAGVYLLRLETEERNYMVKIIVQ